MPTIFASHTNATMEIYSTREPSNTTNIEKIGIPFEMRLVYQTAAITMTCVVLYIVVALFKFNWIKSHSRQKDRFTSSRKDSQRKRSKNSAITSDSSTSTNHKSSKARSVSERGASALRIMCVLASVLTFIRICCEQLELAPLNESRLDCRDYQVAMVATYAVSLSTLYAILWYRVKLFLSHPAMRHLGSKTLNILAYLVLCLIGIASIANAVMFLVSTVSVDSVGGCMVLSPGDIVSNSTRFAILTASTVAFQASLLALFLYPLVRHRATMRAGKIATPTTKRKYDSNPKRNGQCGGKKKVSPRKKRNQNRKFRRQQAIIKIIRRVMMTAILCAISDIFCGLIVQTVVELPRIITNLIFDANLLINLACVLASFKDWRRRLFPCCTKKRKPRRKDTQLSTIKCAVREEQLKYIKEQLPTSTGGFSSSFTARDRKPEYHSSESGIHSISPQEGSIA